MCQNVFFFVLTSVVIQSVNVFSIIMLNLFMMNVIMLSVIYSNCRSAWLASIDLFVDHKFGRSSDHSNTEILSAPTQKLTPLKNFFLAKK